MTFNEKFRDPRIARDSPQLLHCQKKYIKIIKKKMLLDYLISSYMFLLRDKNIEKFGKNRVAPLTF